MILHTCQGPFQIKVDACQLQRYPRIDLLPLHSLLSYKITSRNQSPYCLTQSLSVFFDNGEKSFNISIRYKNCIVYILHLYLLCKYCKIGIHEQNTVEFQDVTLKEMSLSRIKGQQHTSKYFEINYHLFTSNYLIEQSLNKFLLLPLTK